MEEGRTPPPPRDDEKRKRRTTSGGSPPKGRQGEKESEEEIEDLTVVSGYVGGSPYLANPLAHGNPILNPPTYQNPILNPPASQNPISQLSTDSSVIPPLEGHASTSQGLSGSSPFKKRLKFDFESGKSESKRKSSSSDYQGQSVSSVPSFASRVEAHRNLLVSGDNETPSITLKLLDEIKEIKIGTLDQPLETLTPIPKQPPPNVFSSPSRKKARSGTPSKAPRSPLAQSPYPDSTRSSDTAGAVPRAKKASSHKRPESLNLINPLSTELLGEMPQTAEIEMSSIPMASAESRCTTIEPPPTMLAEEQELSTVLPSKSVLLEGNLSGEGDHNLSPTNQSESKMHNLSALDQFSSDYSPSPERQPPERQPSENSKLIGISDYMHRCFDCAGYYSRSSCNNCIRTLYRSIHERPISATSSPSTPGPSRVSPLCPGLSPERTYYLGPLYISPRQPRNQYSLPDSTRDMTGHFGSPGSPENYFKPDDCGLARSPNKCCACIGYRLMSENPWLNPFKSTSSEEHQAESPSKSGSPASDTSPNKSKSPDSDSKSLITCRVCLQKFKKSKLLVIPLGDFGDLNIICIHCFKICKNRVPTEERRRKAQLSPKRCHYVRKIFPKLGIRRRLENKGTPDEKPKRFSLSPLKDLFSSRKKKYYFDKEDPNRSWDVSDTPSRRRLFERSLEDSAAGSSSYGAAGTSSYGAAGTSSYGAAGTSSYGAAGTSSYGAAGTSSYGAAGTSSYGAAGTSSYGAAGTSSLGAAGTSLEAADVGGYSVGSPGVYVLPHTGIYFPESDTHSHMLPGAPLQIPSEPSAIRRAQHPPLRVAQHPPLRVAQHPPLPVAQHPPLPVAQQPRDPEVQSPQRTRDKSESYKRKFGFLSRNKNDR